MPTKTDLEAAYEAAEDAYDAACRAADVAYDAAAAARAAYDALATARATARAALDAAADARDAALTAYLAYRADAEALGLSVPFCACGRRLTECDGSRAGCTGQTGMPGVRDTRHPCDMFSPGKPTNGGCQGDDPAAVVTYSEEPSPETGHVGR